MDAEEQLLYHEALKSFFAPLMELDFALQGKSSIDDEIEWPFRIERSQYQEAHRAIATLWKIVKKPELEQVAPSALQVARSNRDFQEFLKKL